MLVLLIAGASNFVITYKKLNNKVQFMLIDYFSVKLRIKTEFARHCNLLQIERRSTNVLQMEIIFLDIY